MVCNIVSGMVFLRNIFVILLFFSEFLIAHLRVTCYAIVITKLSVIDVNLPQVEHQKQLCICARVHPIERIGVLPNVNSIV